MPAEPHFPWATGLLDNVTRANEVPIAGPSSTGYSWDTTNPIQSGFQLHSLLSNALAGNASGDAPESMITTTFWRDFDFYGTLTAGPTGNNYAYLWGRILSYASSALRGVWCAVRPDNGDFIIGETVNDSANFSLGHGTVATFTSGHQIGLRGIGNHLKAYYNSGSGFSMILDHVVPVSGVGRFGVEFGFVGSPGFTMTDLRGGEIRTIDHVYPAYRSRRAA